MKGKSVNRNGNSAGESIRSSYLLRKRTGQILHRLIPVFILTLGYLVILSFLLRLPEQNQIIPEIGKPSPAKVVVPRDLTIPDHAGTLALREQAVEKVLPVLDHIESASEETHRRIDLFFSKAQTLVDTPDLTPEERRNELAQATELSIEENSVTLDLLFSYSRYSLLQKTLKEDFQALYRSGIVPTPELKEMILRHKQKGAYVVNAQGEMALRADVESIRSLPEAKEALRKLIESQFNKPVEDQEPRQLAFQLGAQLLQANLTQNQTLWEQRKNEARNSVQSLTAEIQKNQKLIDEGEVIPAKLQVISKTGQPVVVDTPILLSSIFREQKVVGWSQLLYQAILLGIPLFLWGFYLHRYHSAVWKNYTTLSCLLGIFVLIVALGQLLAYLGGHLQSDLQHVGYAMPVALAGFLITILLDAQLAFFSIFVLAIYSGLIFNDMGLLLVNLTCGLVAVFSISRLRRRIDILWAGVKVSLAAGAVATLLHFVEADAFNQNRADINPLALIAIWSAIHGILTIMLSSLLLPVLEHSMGVVTDIQLLELSQRNELLRRLEAEAPGTYQHSLIVANLAESAAVAVHANGLLAHVAALYHDIGKLTKPTYFSENQVMDISKKTHDKLAPSMSRLLITNHIKEGLELAEKEKLPRFIKDTIQQHHGTTLLTYFYDKALKEDSKDVVSENDYRYPGPKPQTVEIAIIMLADSLEAASRSLPVGIPQGELYQFVRKIINQKFVDNQFEYCDLTLSDLHRLADAFTRSLVSLLHRRVSYPSVPLRAEQEDTPTLLKPSRSPMQNTEIPVGAVAGDSEVASKQGVS